MSYSSSRWVYHPRNGAITVEVDRRPESLFDIFPLIDRLMEDLLTGFSGQRIAFGSLQLEPQFPETAALEGSYQVLLDQEYLGSDLTAIDSILIGEHELLISFSTENAVSTLYRAVIEIVEERATTVAFQLPDRPPEVDERLQAREATIQGIDQGLLRARNRLTEGAYGEASSQYQETQSLIRDTAEFDPYRAEPELVLSTLQEYQLQRQWKPPIGITAVLFGLTSTLPAFGAEREVGAVFLGSEAGSGNHTALPTRDLLDTALFWGYSRTGRAELRLGMALRLLTYELDQAELDPEDILVYEELVGPRETVLPIWGAHTEGVLRLGQGSRPSWELGYQYRLERLQFAGGAFREQGPFYLHRVTFSASRAFSFGTTITGPTARAPPTVLAALARTQETGGLRRTRTLRSRWNADTVVRG